jgi:hypothetical protein
VTVFATQSQHNVSNLAATTADELLLLLSLAMTSGGSNSIATGSEVLFALAPMCAQRLHDDGIDPASAAAFLHEHGRMDLGTMPPGMSELMKTRRPGWKDERHVPPTDTASDVHLIIVGGPGGHSQFMPGFADSKAVTVAIAPTAPDARG